ncbi:two-component system, NarL family, sensor histidine kinase DesK [Actinopolyspora mzabensis]|uniref:Two-component system, NarL family, sensor histidine kinase DesK n=1 Tax=Actinopolyspora mzabensis TaxID=995066 RepID=A0A1G8Z9V4_ACTMZ|nr:histidine kinase [Actinopolyspora mzabensis]SDK11886.1 two-component system, NarL family, sensor histidine kinase DesK [Actinopolyspora mzabensis]
MTNERIETTRGRMRRLNVATMVVAIAPVGALLVVLDSRTWWETTVLSLGVAAALVAVARWTPTGISRVVLPCLLVTSAVWLAGVLVMNGDTAFYGVTIVGAVYAPKLPRYRGVSAVALTAFVAATGAARLLVSQQSVPDVLFANVLIPVGTTVVVTAGMFAGQWYYDVLEELAESREREAELAVARERVRFAGDLHDIQGHTLHVVKLKIALAQKLVRADADRVEGELREISALITDTITRTRELVYAQRRLNLAAELENAKNLLEAAGIGVLVDRDAELEERDNELLGQVLRETTTNILRHAQANQVRITLSDSGITIVNDGVQETSLPELGGLTTLRERVVDHGGELRVEQRDGRFVTAATLPHSHTDTARRREEEDQ